MGVTVGAMQARLNDLELLRGDRLKQRDNLEREIAEIDRDCRILAEALAPEAEETPAPPSGDEKVN